MERREARGEDASVGLGEENGDPPAERSQPVSVRVGQALDESLTSQSTQIVGVLGAGCRAG
jgi:hypothetical protein